MVYGRPTVRRVVLANGLRLLCKQNDSSEIVAVVAQVRAGLPDEPEDRSGLAAVTAEALLKGTTSYTGAAFSQAIVNAGGNLRSQSGFDFTEISALTDRGRWEKALKLVAGVVAHPAFEPAAIDEARDNMRRRRDSFDGDFTAGVYQSVVTELYRVGPYGRSIFGTSGGLARVTPQDVRRFWQENYVQNRITVAIVGDVDPNEAIRVAQRAFEDVPFKASDGPAPIPADTVDRPRVQLLRKPGPAGQLMVGYLAPPVSPANYPVYSVLEALMGGGKRSRLSASIRDDEGIGYVLGATYQPLMGQSHFVAYLMFGVPPPQAGSPVIDKPKSLLLQQFRELVEKGPTDAEVARARSYVIGQHALRHERVRDQAKWLSWFEASGLGHAMDQDFGARAATVTKEQLHAAAKDVFKNYALVISVPPPG